MLALLASFVLISVLPCAVVSADAPRELHLTFVGDIMGHDVNYQMKDFHNIYSGIIDMFLSDDLTFANLEFPLDPFRPRSGFQRDACLFGSGRRLRLQPVLPGGIRLSAAAQSHLGGEDKSAR